MRKKIGFLIAAGAAAAVLHFAVPSADSAVQVEEKAVQSCPAQKSCPATKSCPEGKTSCPMSGEKV